MQLALDAAQARVLGSLLEKEITTPEYYPLTLNGLVAACNQKSNREPVMELDEAAVRQALCGLEEKKLAQPARVEGRAARFEHRLNELLNLGRRESALLCTLLLRGAQTPGELRGRSERMHRLEDLDEVQLVLQKLIDHDPPLARVLPRQPGTKEARYVDCLGPHDCIEPHDESSETPPPAAEPAGDERMAALESEVARLRAELDELRRGFTEFKQQFGQF